MNIPRKASMENGKEKMEKENLMAKNFVSLASIILRPPR